jgi:hypothetical protein
MSLTSSFVPDGYGRLGTTGSIGGSEGAAQRLMLAVAGEPKFSIVVRAA